MQYTLITCTHYIYAQNNKNYANEFTTANKCAKIN